MHFLLILSRLWDIIYFIKVRQTEEYTLAEITKDTIIGDILDLDSTTAPFFFEMGMHCLGCPASRGESLAEACAVHGVDADEMVEKINNHLANK